MPAKKNKSILAIGPMGKTKLIIYQSRQKKSLCMWGWLLGKTITETNKKNPYSRIVKEKQNKHLSILVLLLLSIKIEYFSSW